MKSKTFILAIVSATIACILVGQAYLQPIIANNPIESDEEIDTIEVGGFEEAAKRIASKIEVDVEEDELNGKTHALSSFSSEQIDIIGYDVVIKYTDDPSGKTATAIVTDRSSGEVSEVDYDFATVKEDYTNAIMFKVDEETYDATEVVKATDNCFFWFAAIPLIKVLAAAIAAVVVVVSIPIVYEAFKTIGTALYDLAINYYNKLDVHISKTDVKSVVWQPVIEGIYIAILEGHVLAIMVGQRACSIADCVSTKNATENKFPSNNWYPALLSKKVTAWIESEPIVVPLDISEEEVKALVSVQHGNSFMGEGDIYFLNTFTFQKSTAISFMVSNFNRYTPPYLDHGCDIYPHLHHPLHDRNSNGSGYVYPCHIFYAVP